MIRSIHDYYTYEFTAENDIVVANFQTKTKTRYRVYFYPAKDYFDYLPENTIIYKHGYFFGFTKVGINEDKKEPFDAMVMNTIIHIINSFYESEGISRILIFHCSDDWGKDKKLKRAARFDLWFKYGQGQFTYKKYNEEIDIHEMVNGRDVITDKEYLSLILEASNENIEIILDEFQEIKNHYSREK